MKKSALNIRCTINLEHYYVSESDLMHLAEVSKSNVFLDFGLFSFSLAFGFILAMFTFTSTLAILILTIASTITVLTGVFTTIIWWKGKTKLDQILKKIKKQRLEVP